MDDELRKIDVNDLKKILEDKFGMKQITIERVEIGDQKKLQSFHIGVGGILNIYFE